ncbi:hypothetical protein BGW36DRAFT_321184 [Talaromyces proteolyticus]|uniref:GPI-anchored cell surface glycoprotein n=1 Tax=Talaromyces proteolyticus TaxID=1131652 RepID=A0AAD4PV67_9EURO|nr:uncharacterized protein BGW36DRAFT_321184 [Talaromyces proteolyticus]KAH8696200.1 hypothetical protein BGW36DRAFT_321184 [Talaromyces proteolyticus]
MSLNGLDDPAVIDAYQTALAEAGGWLLLKYASRDEVTLLGRGTGGVPDVRAAVDAYEEKSPLYGFLQYRRRKVVLKYMPDGVSRLIQARTTVQFHSILDKFSPQDTTFEFKTAPDLTESALSSACLLHAASGSMTSSSSSLRRRRLMEIAEDAEEGGPAAKVDLESPLSQDSSKRLSQASDMTAVPPPTRGDDSPSEARNVVEDEADARAETASVHSLSRKKFLDQLAQQPFEHRSSTQSARPSLQELGLSTPYRQKVKLGPRPSVDINGRPRTAGSMSRSQEQRPVAALPAGVRSRKPAGNASRPKSQPDAVPVPTLASLRNAPPVPLLIPPPSIFIPKPKLSPGAKSMNALPSSGMSPEKQRLMKALELRKKQMEKRTQELQKKATQRENTVPQDPSDDKDNASHSQKTKAIEEEPTKIEAVEQKPVVATITVEERKPLPADLAKADSAVEMVDKARDSDESTSDVPSKEAEAEAIPIVMQDDAPKNGAEKLQFESHEPTSQISSQIYVEETASESTVPESTESTNVSSIGADDEKRMSEPEVTQDNAIDMETVQSQNNQEIDHEDGEGERTPTAPVAAQAVEDSMVESQEIIIALAHDEHMLAEVQPEAVPLPEPGADEEEPEVSTAASHVALGAPTAEALQPPLSQPQNEENNHRQKRIALLEPIQVPTPDLSDEDNLLSDDSFMEELKSATFQEAKPVSVGKGPLAPDGEPRTPLEAWQTRAVSNPGRRPSDFNAMPIVGRSASATYPGDENQQEDPIPVLVAKKVNVSSGISKRIKALEMFSNNRDSPTSPALSVPANNNGVSSPTATAFEKFRKRASLSINGGLPSGPPSTRTSFVSPSPEPTNSSLRRKESQSLSKSNSVSVTARIVRDPSTPPTDVNADPLESNALNLQRSPLIVEHNSPEALNSSMNSTPELRPRTFSTRGLSRSSTDTTIPRSESRASSRSRMDDRNADPRMSPEDKKDSRTSRLFRRMSSLTSPRKNLISPTRVEKPLPFPQVEGTEPVPPQAVDIGEVNVQFPDTLLWKRRFLRIDHQGYLVLTPGNMDTGARNIVKRYHLSEFTTPCLPDEDRQELPNSILLDFRNGSTLQCACESRKGQAAILQTLVDAHSAYHH